MRSDNESELVKCIENISDTRPMREVFKASAAVTEGSLLAYSVKPMTNQTFKSYAFDLFKTQSQKHVKEYCP